MKKLILLKKLFIFNLLILFCASGMFSLNWSGIIDNNSKISTSDFSEFTLTQKNSIYLSANAKLGKSGLHFSGEAMYQIKEILPFSNPENSTFINIADLSLLKISGDYALKKGSLSISAGRFNYYDLTNTVFSQTSDGLYLSYDSMKIKTSLYAGFTGLLNSLNVTMTDVKTYDYYFYNLAVPYIPVIVDFSYKSFLQTNTLATQLLCFFEPTGEFTSKYYGTLSLSGPIKTFANYKLNLTVGTQNFNDLMAYADADFSFFIQQKGIISVGVEYASGNQAVFSPFTTITYQTGYNAAIAGAKSSVIIPKLSQLFVTDNMVFSIYEKLVMLAPQDITINGIEFDINYLVNVLSDVQIAIDALAYFDFKENLMNNQAITIKAILSF